MVTVGLYRLEVVGWSSDRSLGLCLQPVEDTNVCGWHRDVRSYDVAVLMLNREGKERTARGFGPCERSDFVKCCCGKPQVQLSS